MEKNNNNDKLLPIILNASQLYDTKKEQIKSESNTLYDKNRADKRTRQAIPALSTDK